MPDRPDLFAAAERPYLEVTLPAFRELMEQPDRVPSALACLELIPRPQGLDQLSDDDQYLQLRIRACHDIWHLVAGFPTTLPGEVALNGFGARQLRQPAPVLLLAADLLSRAHLQDTTPDLADAVSFGLRLGGVCAPLLPQRWEQAWTMPLAQHPGCPPWG